MRRHKGLAVFFIFLVVVNLAYFAFKYWFNVDDVILEQVEHYLAREFNLKAEIGGLSITDRRLDADNITVDSPKFHLEVGSLSVGYSLNSLLFNHRHHVDDITISDVVFNMDIKPSADTSKTIIPDWSRYFNSLTLQNGSVQIAYNQHGVDAREKLDKINVIAHNQGETSRVLLQARSALGGFFKARGSFTRGQPDSVRAQFFDYRPQHLRIQELESLKIQVSGSATYRPDNIDYSVTLDSLAVKHGRWYLNTTGMQIDGDLEQAVVLGGDLHLLDAPTVLWAKINHLSSAHPTLEATANARNVDLTHFWEGLHGKAGLDLTASGSLTAPRLDGTATCDYLEIVGMEYRDIELGVNSPNATDYHVDVRGLTFVDSRYQGKVDWLNDHLQMQLVNPAGTYGWHKLTASGDLKADGTYRDGNLNVLASVENGRASWGDYHARIGHMQGSFILNPMKAEVQMNQVDLSGAGFEITGASAHGVYQPDSLNAVLENPGCGLRLEYAYGIKTGYRTALAEFNRTNLLALGKNSGIAPNLLPTLTGRAYYRQDADSTLALASLAWKVRPREEFSGNLQLDYRADRQNARGTLLVKNGWWRNRPFQLVAEAAGKPNSSYEGTISINNQINGEYKLGFSPELSYQVNLHGQNLDIHDYLLYALDRYQVRGMGGSVNFDISYNSRRELAAAVSLDSVFARGFRDLSLKTKVEGSLDSLHISEMVLSHKNVPVLFGGGKVRATADPACYLYAEIPPAVLDSLLAPVGISGEVSGSVDFTSDAGNRDLELMLFAQNARVEGLAVDSLAVAATVSNQAVYVQSLEAYRHGLFEFSAQGGFPWDLYTNRPTEVDTLLHVTFNGDLLKMLSQNVDGLEDGSSHTKLDFDLGIAEEQLTVRRGTLSLINGRLHLPDQQESTDRINLDMSVSDNRLTINQASLRQGRGYLYLENDIMDDGRDLIFGVVNAGHIFAKTDPEGLDIHVPGFNPENTSMDVILGGMDAEYAEVLGPLDDMRILAQVELSNGKVIFPPNTTNLMRLVAGYTSRGITTGWDKLFGKREVAPDPKADELPPLPFQLDAMIKLGENVRYTTFPADIGMEPGSYLWLKYNNGKFKAYEAEFTAKEGTLDMLGTTFEVDEVKIIITRYQENPIISAVFNKKVSDGSTITMSLVPDEEDGKMNGKLKFTLSSDNPDDTSESRILAKLSYDRSIEDVSAAQQQTMYQDEALQLAGVGLGQSVVTPLIAPVENRLRKLLDLDQLSLKPGWVQNLVEQYTGSSQLTQGSRGGFSSDMLWDKMSLEAGRYVKVRFNRKNQLSTYINYELYVEKRVDKLQSGKTTMDVYHTINLRYDLPWKMKLNYSLEMEPDKKLSNELMVQRSLRFW